MTQYQAKDRSLTVYLGGIAHVGAAVQLSGNENSMQITGIARTAMLDSLHTTGDDKVRVLEARVREETSYDDVAKQLVGATVTESAVGKDGDRYRVVAVKGEQAVLERNGLLYVESLQGFNAPADGITLNQKNAVELHVAGVPKKGADISLSYLADGISLTPTYTIAIKGSKLVLTAEIGIDNRTGKSFDNVALQVVPGEVGRPYFQHGYEPITVRKVVAATTMMSEEALFALDEMVAVKEEQDQIRYDFSARNVPEGSSKFGVFKTKPLKHTIGYTAHLREGTSQVSAVLRFAAPITLPAGAVAVFSETKQKDSKTEKYEGGSTLQTVLKNRRATISLRQPDTLDVRVLQKGETKIDEATLGEDGRAPVYALTRTYEVTVRNAGAGKATIETYLGLNIGEKVLACSISDHEKSTARQKRWDVSVPAGEKRRFTYTTQEPIQFRNVSREDIEALLRKGKRSSRQPR